MHERNFRPENPGAKKEDEGAKLIEEARDAFREMQREECEKAAEKQDRDIAGMDLSSIGLPEARLWKMVTAVNSPEGYQEALEALSCYRKELVDEIRTLREKKRGAEADALNDGKGRFAGIVGNYFYRLDAKYREMSAGSKGADLWWRPF